MFVLIVTLPSNMWNVRTQRGVVLVANGWPDKRRFRSIRTKISISDCITCPTTVYQWCPSRRQNNADNVVQCGRLINHLNSEKLQFFRLVVLFKRRCPTSLLHSRAKSAIYCLIGYPAISIDVDVQQCMDQTKAFFWK